ncbi:hypothetical protein B0A49_07193, partial [Cryomyces minteri]
MSINMQLAVDHRRSAVLRFKNHTPRTFEVVDRLSPLATIGYKVEPYHAAMGDSILRSVTVEHSSSSTSVENQSASTTLRNETTISHSCSSNSLDTSDKMMNCLPRMSPRQPQTVLPPAYRSYDMAYFLRNTGPPQERAFAVKAPKNLVSAHARQSVPSHKSALRFLKNGYLKPAQRSRKTITLKDDAYAQSDSAPSISPDILDSRVSVSFADELGSDTLDTWLSAFSTEHAEEDRTPANVYGQNRSTSGSTIRVVTCEEIKTLPPYKKDVTTMQPVDSRVDLTAAQPQESMRSRGEVDANAALTSNPITPPGPRDHCRSLSSNSPELPSRSPLRVKDGNRYMGPAIGKTMPAPLFASEDALRKPAVLIRKNREEKIRDRKLRDLQRDRQNIDEVVQRPVEITEASSCNLAKPVTLDVGRLRPPPLQIRTTTEDDKTGYTPVTGQTSLSPVMLVAEGAPVVRAKHVKKPAALTLGNARSTRPCAVAVRQPQTPSPPSSPTNTAPASSSNCQPVGTPTPTTAFSAICPPVAPPHQKLLPIPEPKSLGARVPVPQQQQRPPSSAQQRASISSSSYTSASKEARLEARLEALERENKLLEAALMAVLKTGGALNR